MTARRRRKRGATQSSCGAPSESEREVGQESEAVAADRHGIGGVADRRILDPEAHDVHAEILTREREIVEAEGKVVGVSKLAEDLRILEVELQHLRDGHGGGLKREALVEEVVVRD